MYRMQKDAESQFQQIDTKEGTLLEMEDYSGSKRWFFRFKYATSLRILIFSQLQFGSILHQKSILYGRLTLLIVLVAFMLECCQGNTVIWWGRWWINIKSRMYVLENTGIYTLNLFHFGTT